MLYLAIVTYYWDIAEQNNLVNCASQIDWSHMTEKAHMRESRVWEKKQCNNGTKTSVNVKIMSVIRT